MLKKVFLIIPVVILFAAGSVLAAVATTAHDMSAGTALSNTDAGIDGQTCIFCHTPHGGGTNAPLWNRATTGTALYTVYSSSTMNATVNQPGGVSLACLGCHDGAVSVGYLLNVNGAAKTVALTPVVPANYTSGAMAAANPAYVGTSLVNDHPVGINYASAVAGGGLKATPTDTSAAGTPLYGTGDVECGSCHNPHDNTNGNFLRMANTASALCLNCHTY